MSPSMLRVFGLALWISVLSQSSIDAAKRPNFIFILTDDQSTFFNSTSIMPSLSRYIIDEGITFSNSFVATTKCCPSRTETITGRYFQNIRAKDESLNTCMHIASQYNVINNTNSMFHTFSKAGYTTGSFGKLVNEQRYFWCNDNPYIDTFDRINAECKENYYQLLWFDKYLNKTYKLHNITSSASNYLTSVVGNNSIEFIKDVIDLNKLPFIMWIGAHAPHHPATPPKWYGNFYNNLTAPRTPNYDLQSLDKIEWIAGNPSFDGNATIQIDQEYRDRFRSLLPVDDLIYAIFQLLNNYPDVLDNTYFIFSSDHGYHLGQWRLPTEKHLPYDTDLRVPLFMRGPGITPKSISYDVVGNVDILPTMLNLAGINYDNNIYDGMDWSSILFRNETNKWQRDTFLSQYISTGTQAERGNNVWFPGKDGSLYPGKDHGAGCCNDQGVPYYVDNGDIGNWRAIRIINNTLNIMYIEWIHLPNNNASFWNQTQFDNPYFHEYYNLTHDIWQIHNQYTNIPNYQQKQLHDILSNYGQCQGLNCH